MARFIETAYSEVLVSGGQVNSADPINNDHFWLNTWTKSNIQLAAAGKIRTRISPENPNNRMWEVLGSNINRQAFLAVDAHINGSKGRIMGGNAPNDLAVSKTHHRVGKASDPVQPRYFLPVNMSGN